MPKVPEAEVQDTLHRLRVQLPPGSTVYTILRHTSSSGMARDIQPFVVVNGAPWDLTYNLSRIGFRRAPKNAGLRVNGAGMDMGFHLVYSLSRTLYPDGHACTGFDGRDGTLRCPSNDHTNDWNTFSREGQEQGLDGEALREFIRGRLATSYDVERVHSDGGYALSQSWF